MNYYGTEHKTPRQGEQIRNLKWSVAYRRSSLELIIHDKTLRDQELRHD